MSPATRYLWHQRLAWLLMVYVAAVGVSVGAASATGASQMAELFGGVLQCAIIMTCVKDSALRRRPMPYSWRLPMLATWPVAIFLVEWRARRRWGIAWVALHGFLLFVVLIAVQICLAIAERFL